MFTGLAERRNIDGQTYAHEGAGERLREMFTVGWEQPQMRDSLQFVPNVGDWEGVETAEVNNPQFPFKARQ